ncbi:MAG: helix-turn-helix domain-containing protein [Anaerocolumna sp.]
MKIMQFKNLNKKIRERYSDKFLLRLVSSYSLILLIILVLGVFNYKMGITSVRDNLIKENNNILKNAVIEVDKSFQIMLSLNYQIANNTDITKFVETKDHETNSSFFINVLKARNYLINLYSVQNLTFIDTLFVYAHNTDYVLSASELENSSLYYHYNRRYNRLNYEAFMDSITNSVHAGKPQKLNTYSSTRDDFLLYSFPMSMYKTGKVNNANICYTINKEYMEEIFSDLNLYDIGFIYVTDSEGNGLLEMDTPNSLIPSDINEITKQYEKDHQESITIQDEKFVISTYSSPNNQWTYYLVQPQSMVFNQLNHYQSIYVTVIVFALIIGIILLFVLSHNNLVPFKKIEGILENSLTEDDGIFNSKYNDVRHTIDHYVSLLLDKKATMQQMLEWQRPIIYSSSLSRLLNGQVNTVEETEKIAEILRINTKSSNFTVLYVNVYLNELDFSIDDTIHNKGSYQEIIKEVFYNYFGESIYIYEVVSQSFIILLSWNQEDTDHLDQVEPLFFKVHEDLKNKYSLTIYGGVSDVYSDLMLTWQAYQHAAEALNYAGLGSSLQFYDTMERNINSYYFPIELEQQLVNFITNGKQAQVDVILENIYHENFEKRVLPITIIKYLLSDLRNTLLKVRFMLTSDHDTKEKLDELDEKMGQKKTFELIQEIAGDLCALFDSKSTQHLLIERIKEYIKENYMDSSLSLNKISEEFKISESYFSFLFKEVTKENFSDYLEKIRMDKATILLSTTSINIADIAKEVGYNNTASFRRAFKRISSITPAEVRKVNLFTSKNDID